MTKREYLNLFWCAGCGRLTTLDYVKNGEVYCMACKMKMEKEEKEGISLQIKRGEPK